MSFRSRLATVFSNAVLRSASNQLAACSNPSLRHLSGIADFFEQSREPDKKVVIGRAWEAWELRGKSFDDLHKLWYILQKEKNMLYSQKMMLRSQGRMMVQPHRIKLVKKSLCRIKHVLTERALAVEDEDKRRVYQKLINDM